MRLINASTLEQEEFYEPSTLRYACLSHRWTKDEVTLQQYQNLATVTLREKAGYKKVLQTCEQAREQKIPYVWVDTCCIDKTSSAELSEAINSMWSWYQKCEVCFVYLHDIKAQTWSQDPEIQSQMLSSCEWTSRAWTLQELLAPDRVEIYDCNWQYLGDKLTLGQAISSSTGVDLKALQIFEQAEWSVAQKMSWASKRSATRQEDVAYSLLGLFEVNMPLLYGEGTKAFTRLQEEIIRRSADKSIFTWDPIARTRAGRLFAESPAEFNDSADCVSSVELALNSGNSTEDDTCMTWLSAWTINNLGLEMDLLLTPWSLNVYAAWVGRQGRGNQCFMLLRRLKATSAMILERADDRLLRATSEQMQQYQFRYERRKALVVFRGYSKVPSLVPDPTVTTTVRVKLPEVSIGARTAHILATGARSWTKVDAQSMPYDCKFSLAYRYSGLVGAVHFETSSTTSTLIVIGLDFDFKILCKISHLTINFAQLKQQVRALGSGITPGNHWIRRIHDWENRTSHMVARYEDQALLPWSRSDAVIIKLTTTTALLNVKNINFFAALESIDRTTLTLVLSETYVPPYQYETLSSNADKAEKFVCDSDD